MMSGGINDLMCDCDVEDDCRALSQMGIAMRMNRQSHNLAIGAGLCRAFRLGFDEGWGVTGEGFNAEYCCLTEEGYERIATTGTHNEGMPE